MQKPCSPAIAPRFFSAFQRYITLTRTSRSNYHTIRSNNPPKSLFRSPSFRHQFASTTTNPPAATPKPPTHYELFPTTLPNGPPPASPFTIDTKALRKEYLQLQARAHPDRHQGASKAKAEGTSALINEAYKTLSSPLLRAQYLLQLRGIDVAEDEVAKVEDPELLIEVLEARESIEAAEEERDLEGLRGTNEGRIEESTRILERAFRWDDWERARAEAVRLRYWVNIRESLDAWEEGKPVVLVH